MNMQIIKTDTGQDLAVLPLDEYNNLIERLKDALATKQRINAGEEETFPANVVNRLLEGDNPVRVYREHRGMTSKFLAIAAEISAPYLSEIETGKKEGSAATLKRIAQALSVDLDDLVEYR